MTGSTLSPILSKDHQAKPKFKNSRTQISEFMSFGLHRSINRREGARHSCRFITRLPSDVEAA